MSKINSFNMGGIHPNKFKISSHSPIVDAGIPEFVHIPVRQHIGNPAIIKVKKGDYVRVGSLLADADGVVSADVHSSVSGEVFKVEQAEKEGGYYEEMITIKTSGDEWEENIDRSEDIVREIDKTSEEIIQIIRSAGIVGMGGAGYPTPIKTTIPAGKKVDCVILNGIECEPYLTADDRLMVEFAEQIIIGAKILNKVLGIQKAIIAIDENKPEAIEIMQKLTRGYVGVNVVPCKTKYPQGAEKQLIEAITGREVPPGCLPIDVNCLVQNVGTVFAIYEAVQKNKPLFERIVTVSGDDVVNPRNYRVRVGTPASFLISQSQTYTEATKVVFGGPMMGLAAINPEAPVTKITSGILLLKEEGVDKPEPTACIRCARCIDACPQGLEPQNIATCMRNGNYVDAKKLSVINCIECGCCSFVCPARIPLLDYCKLAKYEIRKNR